MTSESTKPSGRGDACFKQRANHFPERIEGENIPLIKLISDTGKLLGNVHHAYIKSLRTLVSTHINKQFKDRLIDAPASRWMAFWGKAGKTGESS